MNHRRWFCKWACLSIAYAAWIAIYFVISELLWAWKLKIFLNKICEIAFKDINRLIHVIKDSKFTYPRWNILKPTLVWNIRSCITEVSSNWTRKEIKLSKISRYFSKDGEWNFYVHVDEVRTYEGGPVKPDVQGCG